MPLTSTTSSCLMMREKRHEGVVMKHAFLAATVLTMLPTLAFAGDRWHHGGHGGHDHHGSHSSFDIAFGFGFSNFYGGGSHYYDGYGPRYYRAYYPPPVVVYREPVYCPPPVVYRSSYYDDGCYDRGYYRPSRSYYYGSAGYRYGR
jgi:hypothetical protein